MSKRIQNTLLVSFITLVSRVLGLARDTLMFAFLGVGPVSAAFVFAFTVPNLFRRLLGEGALSSAFIPIFSGLLEQEGKERAFSFLNQVISYLSCFLFGLVFLGVLSFWLLSGVETLEYRWHLGALLGVILVPYLFLVCLAAILGAALNVIGHFSAHALSSVWLNLAMVLSLLCVAYPLKVSLEGIAYCLCIGVLLGGCFQVWVPARALYKRGWRPFANFHLTASILSLWSLFLPGVLGAAVFQLNIIVTRLFAMYLNADAVSVLYLANRLVELPMGLFTIAVATVFFPDLSSRAALNDTEGLRSIYLEGMRVILAITIPAAAGLIALKEPIVHLLFEWGRFTPGDAIEVSKVILIFSLSIPFYSLATFATRAFHARKDTKTPVKIAFLALVINAILTVVFMNLWGTLGLALATLVAIILQSLYLQYQLSHKERAFALNGIMRALLFVVGASLVMFVAVFLFKESVLLYCGAGKQSAALMIVGGMLLGIGLYYYTLKVLKFEGLDMLIKILRRKKSQSPTQL